MVTAQRSGGLPSAFSFPPDLLKKYNNWISSNPSTISQIESTLRSLTYLLPGARLSDSELASESILTLTNLLSLYHDSVLGHLPGKSVSKAEPHARYVKFWMNRSRQYKFLARLLKTVQYTELLWEMVGRRKGGERGRWRVVVFLESVKAVIRLCLCWLTGGRWVLTSPLPDREDIKETGTQPEEELPGASQDDGPVQGNDKSISTRWANGVMTPPLSDSEKVQSSSASPEQSPPRSQPEQPAVPPSSTFTLPRTNMSFPPLPLPSQISDYLSFKTLSASSVRPAPTLLSRLATSQSQIAELLYILRPLIYAILMSRVAGRHVVRSPDIPSTGVGRPSWKREWMPWAVGLAMEWGSRQLMKRDIERRIPGGMRGLSDVEKEEVKKRGYAIGWWAMRGAFYETFTRNFITSASTRLKSKPTLDLVGGIIDDYEYIWDNYYFSTSSM